MTSRILQNENEQRNEGYFIIVMEMMTKQKQVNPNIT
jgi:hypothetical protein